MNSLHAPHLCWRRPEHARARRLFPAGCGMPAAQVNTVYSTCSCMSEGLVSTTIDTVVTYVPIFLLVVLFYPLLNAELLAIL